MELRGAVNVMIVTVIAMETAIWIVVQCETF